MNPLFSQARLSGSGLTRGGGFEKARPEPSDSSTSLPPPTLREAGPGEKVGTAKQPLSFMFE